MEPEDETRYPLIPLPGWEPSQPLWQRVPTRTPEGEMLADFMVLIPGLNRLSPLQRRHQLHELGAALYRFQHVVVFADLNLRLNVLWVSFKPANRVCLDIVAEIQRSVPGALLVSSHVPR